MKLILSICLFWLTFNSHAALNKWVDSEGKVHYSDSRPPDIKVKTIRSSSAPDSIVSESSVAAPKSIAEREVEWKKNQQAKEKAEKKAAIEKENESIKQKNCERAKSYLTTLENSPRLVTYNEKGERTLMDDSSRSKETEEASKSVSTYCN